MKKHTTMLLGMFILVLLSRVTMTSARVHRVKSERNFDYILRNAHFSVILFYSGGRNDKDEGMNHLKDVFEDLSNRGRYKDAEIVFMRVNIDSRNMITIAEHYDITEYPSFILFDEDEPMIDENELPIILTGFVTRVALKQFIEDNLETRIAETIKQKDELVKRRRDEAKVSWVPYYYPYDYYYPYWDFYGRSPSYSPSLGFGFGVQTRYRPHSHNKKYYGKYHRGYRHYR